MQGGKCMIGALSGSHSCCGIFKIFTKTLNMKAISATGAGCARCVLDKNMPFSGRDNILAAEND